MALIMMSSPVKGFRPGRALVAGFFFTVIFAIPGSVKAPCFLRLRPTASLNSSNTADTSFLLRSVASAICVYSSLLVGGLVEVSLVLDFFFVAAFLAMRAFSCSGAGWIGARRTARFPTRVRDDNQSSTFTSPLGPEIIGKLQGSRATPAAPVETGLTRLRRLPFWQPDPATGEPWQIVPLPSPSRPAPDGG